MHILGQHPECGENGRTGAQDSSKVQMLERSRNRNQRASMLKPCRKKRDKVQRPLVYLASSSGTLYIAEGSSRRQTALPLQPKCRSRRIASRQIYLTDKQAKTNPVHKQRKLQRHAKNAQVICVERKRLSTKHAQARTPLRERSISLIFRAITFRAIESSLGRQASAYVGPQLTYVSRPSCPKYEKWATSTSAEKQDGPTESRLTTMDGKRWLPRTLRELIPEMQ